MFNLIKEMLSYPFLSRAIIVGTLVSLCSALLGVSLVLKRYSMIGDGLSHVGFGALAIATALGVAPLRVSIPVVVIAAFVLLKISESRKIKGDSAIAVISSASLAIGVITVSMTTGMNTDVCNYLFGSILSISKTDAKLSIILSVIVIFIFVIFYNRIFAITFDEAFSKATGTNAGAYNLVLAVLTAVTIVIGMRMMGALLISSLIIFPPLTAMRVCRKFKSVIIVSAVVSVVCFFVGMTFSYALQTPSGASVVAVNIIALAVFAATEKIRSFLMSRRDVDKNEQLL